MPFATTTGSTLSAMEDVFAWEAAATWCKLSGADEARLENFGPNQNPTPRFAKQSDKPFFHYLHDD
jgi:hypothetical protein